MIMLSWGIDKKLMAVITGRDRSWFAWCMFWMMGMWMMCVRWMITRIMSWIWIWFLIHMIFCLLLLKGRSPSGQGVGGGVGGFGVGGRVGAGHLVGLGPSVGQGVGGGVGPVLLVDVGTDILQVLAMWTRCRGGVGPVPLVDKLVLDTQLV